MNYCRSMNFIILRYADSVFCGSSSVVFVLASGFIVISNMFVKIFCSKEKTFLESFINVAASTWRVCFLKLGDNLRH